MSDEIWDMLDIPATSDPRLIRRAYAAKAKRMDADADPAGFMQLRAAYDEALVWAAGFCAPPPPPAPPYKPKPRREADQGPVPPPRPAGPPPAEVGAFEAAFERAYAEGRLAPLLAAYRGGLARGLVPLGRSGPLLRKLVEVASGEPAAAPSDLKETAALAARSPDLPGALLQELNDRVAAEDWWARTLAESRRHRPLVGEQGPRIADALVGRHLRTTFRPKDKAALEAALAELRRHAPHLEGRAPPGRADRLERRMRRHYAPTWREQLFDSLSVLAVGLLLFILAKLLPD